MQMVFQDPYSSLDPKRTIAESIGEPFAVHGKMRRSERDANVERLLETVGHGLAPRRIATRTSSRAASASGSRSPERSRSTPRSSCATSR